MYLIHCRKIRSPQRCLWKYASRWWHKTRSGWRSKLKREMELWFGYFQKAQLGCQWLWEDIYIVVICWRVSSVQWQSVISLKCRLNPQAPVKLSHDFLCQKKAGEIASKLDQTVKSYYCWFGLRWECDVQGEVCRGHHQLVSHKIYKVSHQSFPKRRRSAGIRYYYISLGCCCPTSPKALTG